MIRFLHAADVHLGARITRFDQDACTRIGEARFTALQQLRAKAADLKVDFIVIAGDLFDDHSASRFDANRAFAILESSAGTCPVFIIPGNHDPLVPGGVWDRDPWLREQPHLRVRLLRNREPVTIDGLPVTLFPCPLFNRRSMDDPTAWIERHVRDKGDSNIRIGIAHGSLRILPSLPDDDHLIRPDAVTHYGLDYLALGHWHRHLLHKEADGAGRTAYSGTHETMTFPGSNAGTSGWSSFSADGDGDRFVGDGLGSALHVTIDGPGAPPVIETVNVGQLNWLCEEVNLTGQSIGQLIGAYSNRANVERTVARLTLSGVVDPRGYSRLEELKQIVLARYHAGSSLDLDSVLIEPNADQMAEVVGSGVLKRVLERLTSERASADAATERVANHALKLLYQIAWEEQPQ